MLSFIQPLLLWLALTSNTLVTAQSYFITAEANNPPCLVPAEGRNIASRWFQIFQTDSSGVGTGAAIVESTLTSDFKYYDEGASFGNPDPVYNSSQAVYDSVSGTGYSGNLVTSVTYTVLESLVGCDFVVSRWQSNSVSSNATNVTVPVGTNITYRGTDYLLIDLGTRLINNVTSSSDLLNYYTQLGDDIIASQGSS